MYIQNQNFLKKICQQQNQIIYAKIYQLDFDEKIIKDFTGIISNGSINLDGDSAVRRTCQLTISLDKNTQIDAEQMLESKVKIDIGLKNLTNEYKDNNIIWFPMGVFYLTNFSLTNSLKSLIINLQGKDKMVKLTGEIGGSFNSIVDFGTIEIQDEQTGTFTKKSLKIKDIIKEMIHTYGQEPYEKIFIYDLDDYGLNLISYKGEDPIYIFLKEDEQEEIRVINYVFDSNYEVKNSKEELISLSEISDDDFFISKYNILNKKQNYKSYKVKKGINTTEWSDELYYIKKCNNGDIVGYELTELVYNNDLLGAVGENVTTILNKIKNMLGTDNYEYYYDLNGNFIFKKQDSFAQIESYLNPFVSFSKPTFSFQYNQLVSNLSETIDLTKIKNDFVVWGNRGNSKDSALQFHTRIAIDEKPKEYVSFEINEGTEKNLKQRYPSLYSENISLQQKSIKYTTDIYDWREIIYQMAQDYKKFNQISEFHSLIIEANKDNDYNKYDTGITGYERYYADIDGFWRTLYQQKILVKEDEELSDKYYYYIIDFETPIKYFNESNPETKLTVSRNKNLYENLNIHNFYQEINYDINSYSLKNQMIYQKSINEIGTEVYEEIGYLDNIIQVNYKILSKLYQLTNRNYDKDFVIAQDLETGKQEILNCKQDLVRLVNEQLNKKNLHNKKWNYLKEKENESEFIGIYYDLKKLYIKKNNLTLNEENEPEEVYELINEYPQNQYGDSLTNLENIYADTIGLMLWAQMNNKLQKFDKEFDPITGYNKYIYTDPSKLIFWFDFLDDMTFSKKHNIQTIGPREYIKTNNNIKCVAQFNTFDNIFLNYEKDYVKDEEKIKEFFKTSFAQRRYNIPFFRLAKKDIDFFNITSMGISAIELINNYIYNYNYMSSSVSINAIPQYFLQPNTLIEIVDFEKKKINKYIAKKISFSFSSSFNGQMSINGSKLVDQEYVEQDLRKEFLNE